MCLSRVVGQTLTFTVAPSATATEFTVKFLDRAKNGKRIRLGIAAPQSVQVVRNELIDKPRKD